MSWEPFLRMPKSSPFPSSEQGEEQEEKMNKLFNFTRVSNYKATKSPNNSPVQPGLQLPGLPNPLQSFWRNFLSTSTSFVGGNGVPTKHKSTNRKWQEELWKSQELCCKIPAKSAPKRKRAGTAICLEMREVYTQKNQSMAISALNWFHVLICIYFTLTFDKFANFQGYNLTDEAKAHWVLC